MNERPDALPKDALDLIEAEKDFTSPDHEVHERLFARLAPLVLPGAGAGGLSNVGEATASVAWRAKLLTIAVSASFGAAGGAATHALLASEGGVQPPPKVSVEPTPSAAAAPRPVREVAPLVPGVDARIDDRADARKQVSRSKHSGTTPPRVRGSTDLRAERLLVETASSALLRSDHASALETLRAHAKQYPRGVLAEEREVLMIKALAASGDMDAAKRRARAFKRRFPKSLQGAAVEKVTKRASP